jgi:hypothetical protein
MNGMIVAVQQLVTLHTQYSILVRNILLNILCQTRVSAQKFPDKFVRYENEQGTELFTKKLVRKVGAFFYKKNISFNRIIGMVNGSPYFLTGGNKSEIIIVGPDAKFVFFLHAGILHKQ